MTQLHNNITPCSMAKYGSQLYSAWEENTWRFTGGAEFGGSIHLYIASLYIAIVLNGWRD